MSINSLPKHLEAYLAQRKAEPQFKELLTWLAEVDPARPPAVRYFPSEVREGEGDDVLAVRVVQADAWRYYSGRVDGRLALLQQLGYVIQRDDGNT